ncbi:MAG: ubiquinol-cytochrome c reductase iron-sulfur subunit [Pseudomonadota bacterium]
MTTTETASEEGVRRRDWIHIAAISFAGFGAGSVVIPLASQMGPSADVLAASTTELDISGIEAGQSVKGVFRGQPLFVKRLTAAEIAAAKADDGANMPDPQTLAERTNPANEAVLVTLGVCTHLGCVPLGAAEGENKGDFGGYFCPCHGSHYDVAGRIRKGPAPKNLAVPDFEFKSEGVIRVG